MEVCVILCNTEMFPPSSPLSSQLHDGILVGDLVSAGSPDVSLTLTGSGLKGGGEDCCMATECSITTVIDTKQCMSPYHHIVIPIRTMVYVSLLVV